MSILLAGVIAQAEAEPEKSNYENCKEDYKQPADKPNVGCKECKPTFTVATSDITGTDYKENKCIECGEKCLSCDADTSVDPAVAGKCKSCVAKHGIDPSDEKKCIPCADANCEKCDVNAAACTQCKPKFGLQNGACEACSENCLECTSTTDCTKCDAKFALKSGACEACPAGCDECNDKGECTKCSPGSNFLDKTTKQCKPCKENCLSCTDGETCSQCKSGYYLYQNACQTACPAAFASVNGVCARCAANCQACEAFDTCTKCNTGFYVQNNQCTQCPTNCGECSSTGQCLSCNAGTTLQSDGTCGTSPWYQKWWIWFLVTLAAIGLLAACASMLGKSGSPGTRQYAGYQQYDGNTSYAARSQYEMNASQGQF